MKLNKDFLTFMTKVHMGISNFIFAFFYYPFLTYLGLFTISCYNTLLFIKYNNVKSYLNVSWQNPITHT